jgi:hypothetical protein
MLDTMPKVELEIKDLVAIFFERLYMKAFILIVIPTRGAVIMESKKFGTASCGIG